MGKLSKLGTIIVGVFITISSFAQLQTANDLFDNFEYREAIKYFNQITEKDDETQLKLAYSHYIIHDFKNAETEFAKIIENADVNPINYHFYGVSLKNNAKYTDAETWLNKFKEIDSLHIENNMALGSLDYIEEKSNERPKYDAIKMDWINDGLAQFSPRYFKEGIIFCSEFKFDEEKSRPKIDYGENEIKSDDLVYGMAERPLAALYYMSVNGDEFGEPVKIVGDDTYHIGDFDVNETTGEIYFTKIDLISKWNPDSRSHPRLFKGIFDDESRALINVEKVKIKKLSNNDGAGHPTLFDDGNKMIFASNRPGGIGASDLYLTEKDGDSWTEPVNLGDKINTAGDELYPYLENDQTLYFSSNGRIGFGYLDIYKATINGTEIGVIEHLPYPLNSSSDDIGILNNPNSPDDGLVVSNRMDEGFGDDDLFHFMLSKSDLYVTGIVTNEDGTPAVNSLVKVLDENGVEVGQAKTDEEGRYEIAGLEKGNEYEIVATTKGYAANHSFSTDENYNPMKDRNMILEPSATAQGQVLNQDGTVASNIEISLFDDEGNLIQKSMTDENGFYQFPMEDNENYEVIARTEGYMGSAKFYTDENFDTNKDTDIILMPTEIVQGIITDVDGNPVAGALVKILDENGVEVAQVRTDENGHYQFEVPYGSYELIASTNGFGAKQAISVDVNWDEDEYVNMQLEPTDTVQGLVLNEDGSPAANTVISLFDKDGNLLVQSKTDENGNYQFVLEENKEYDVVATKGNLEGSDHIVTDENWDTNSGTNIQLAPKEIVKGIIRDKDGNPVSGAIVKLYDDQGNLIATTTTDENGQYQFALEKDKNYQIVASTDGFEGVENIYTGDKWDGNKMLDIKLEPVGHPTKGLITDKLDGSGLEQVTVTLIDEETQKKFVTYTDEAGIFNLKLSPNKTYTIKLEKDGYFPKSVTIKAGDKLPETIDLNKEHDLGMDQSGYKVDRIYFDLDKSSLTNASKQQINMLADVMKKNKKALVYINSYADCRGRDEYNIHLSYRRGKQVKEYLIAKGIKAARIGTKSMGAVDFVNNCINPDDCTESEHALNRRSEFEIKF